MSDLVLLTGASGSLGRRLTPALRDAGWRVRALVHEHPAPEADEQVQGTLTDAREAMAGVSGVIHAAALTHARS